MDKTREEFEQWTTALTTDERLAQWEAWQAAKELYAPKWVSVEERLPEPMALVIAKVKLMFTNPMKVIESNVTVMVEDEGWRIGNDLIAWDYDFNHKNLEITHWMELPK